MREDHLVTLGDQRGDVRHRPFDGLPLIDRRRAAVGRGHRVATESDQYTFSHSPKLSTLARHLIGHNCPQTTPPSE